MSFDELENAALKMSVTSRAALVERLSRSLPKSRARRDAGASRGEALKALFSTWDSEDATEDSRELEKRRRELQEFQTALNSNRPSVRRAAELWAKVRQQGQPLADPHALDGDVILAAQALTLPKAEGELVVATTNVKHLGRLIPAKHWREL